MIFLTQIGELSRKVKVMYSRGVSVISCLLTAWSSGVDTLALAPAGFLRIAVQLSAPAVSAQTSGRALCTGGGYRGVSKARNPGAKTPEGGLGILRAPVSSRIGLHLDLVFGGDGFRGLLLRKIHKYNGSYKV